MDIFWLRVLLSFVVGGIWLTLISVVAEKVSHKLAALLGGLPSTLLIALFFIGLNEGTRYAAKATIITPIIFIIDAYFVLLLAFYSKKGYVKALIFSGACWAIIVGLVVESKLKSYPVSLAIWAIGLLILVSVINKVLPTQPVKLLNIKFSNQQLLVRSLFSGGVIAAAVLISHYSGPLIGGIFTAFPALYISTFTILYLARGLNFSQAFAKPLVISGTINTVVYSVAVYFIYPRYGIYTGTIMAFLISILSSFYLVRYLLIYLGDSHRI
jgi:uncharacterized membrane protein (GlpM family)